MTVVIGKCWTSIMILYSLEIWPAHVTFSNKCVSVENFLTLKKKLKINKPIKCTNFRTI